MIEPMKCDRTVKKDKLNMKLLMVQRLKWDNKPYLMTTLLTIERFHTQTHFS